MCASDHNNQVVIGKDSYLHVTVDIGLTQVFVLQCRTVRFCIFLDQLVTWIPVCLPKTLDSLDRCGCGCDTLLLLPRSLDLHLSLSSCKYRCTDDNASPDYRPADYQRQIIGKLSADYLLFISGRIFVQ